MSEQKTITLLQINDTHGYLEPLWLAKTRSGWSGAVASSIGRPRAVERRIGVIGTGWEVGSRRELQVWMW
jgi:hypothetical protein